VSPEAHYALLVHQSSERVAVAIIKAWIETGDGQLKVRITANSESIYGRPQTIGVATDTRAACAIVEEWLNAFVGRTDEMQGRAKAARDRGKPGDRAG
jgi:hypothetical protein